MCRAEPQAPVEDELRRRATDVVLSFLCEAVLTRESTLEYSEGEEKKKRKLSTRVCTGLFFPISVSPLVSWFLV